MTQTDLYPVRCPCGHEFVAPLHDSLNVTRDAELRQRLMDGKINVLQCPQCGQSFHVERPILYHDAASSILVWCYPESDPEKQKRILDQHRVLISRQFAELPPSTRPRKVRFIFGGLDDLIAVVKSLEREVAPSPRAGGR